MDLSEEWAALAGQVETAALPAEASVQEIALAEANRAAEIAAGELIGARKKAEEAREPEPEPESEPEYVLELDGNTSGILSALSAEFEAAVPTLIAAQPQQDSRPHTTTNKSQGANGGTEAPIATNGPVGPLGEVFDQFRADLGENTSAEGEDLETHYNLGIAYREMGLLEEAISEFQKVAKANKPTQAFRYAMQCCTLLGLAFMERGQPSIAAMWYERALETPGLDQETILALSVWI